MCSTIRNPVLPYVGLIPQPFEAGSMLQINGRVKAAPVCFAVNLQTGDSLFPRSDVALHLSPVFSSPPRVVRNSLQDQQWGPEESHGPNFPFFAGREFEILIAVEMEQFQIAIDGQPFADFDFRMPLHLVSHLVIDGDVEIDAIQYEGTMTASKPVEDVKMGAGRPIGFMGPIGSNTSGGPGSNVPPTSHQGGQNFVYPNFDFTPAPDASNPYGPPPSNNPYGPPPSSNPYGPPRPSSPYGPPSGSPYGPPPSGNPYGPPQSSHPYGPPASNNPYGPPPSGSPYGPPSPSHPYQPSSPSQPYGPTSPRSSYGPPSGNYPYGPPPQGYPMSGQADQGHYPGPYPSQPGPYSGTSVVYPGQEKDKSSGGLSSLSSLATGAAAALAGAAGASMLGGKKKHKKKGHMGMGMGGMGGPAAMLATGMGSLLSPGHKKTGGSSPIPIGGAVAAGAAALAGGYMLSKSPMGKIMKPKKMFKHKHKLKGFGGFGSSSSSSSSDEE